MGTGPFLLSLRLSRKMGEETCRRCQGLQRGGRSVGGGHWLSQGGSRGSDWQAPPWARGLPRPGWYENWGNLHLGKAWGPKQNGNWGAMGEGEWLTSPEPSCPAPRRLPSQEDPGHSGDHEWGVPVGQHRVEADPVDDLRPLQGWLRRMAGPGVPGREPGPGAGACWGGEARAGPRTGCVSWRPGHV